MLRRRPKLKPGDILEITAGHRFAYLHYVGRHEFYGDAVVVKPQLQARVSSMPDDYFSDGYVTFYPATAAIAEGLATVAGHLPAPRMPERFRRPGALSGPRVITWLIDDGLPKRNPIVRTELTDEELRLPLATVWGHPYLIDRVAQGWTPANARRSRNDLHDLGPPAAVTRVTMHDEPIPHATGVSADARTISVLAEVSDVTAPHTVLHFLYFPTRTGARRAMAELRTNDFVASEGRAAGERRSWLVLAKHEIVPTDSALEATRSLMEDVAEQFGGNYDGWEAEVYQKSSH